MIRKALRKHLRSVAFVAFACGAYVVASPRHATAAEVATSPSVLLKDQNYRQAFDAFDSAYGTWRETPEKDNSHGGLAWREAYLMLAYMRMYRATGDRTYLRKLCRRFEEILLVRDDHLGRIDDYTSRALAGWGSKSYDKTTSWHVFIVHTGMINLAPAEFVNVVRHDANLRAEFGTTASAWMTTIQECLQDADQYYSESPDKTEGWYRDPRLGLLPLNQSNALGCVLVEMYDATGNSEYRMRAEQLARFFKRRIRTANDHYEWSYWPKESGDSTGAEDISHAAINVDFAMRCAQHDLVFSREDMASFARTWLNSVHRPDGSWAGNVAGTGTSEKYMPGSAGRWLTLEDALDVKLRVALRTDIEAAYHRFPTTMPSHALGLANLACSARGIKN